MTDRDLAHLCPALQAIAPEFLRRCRGLGIDVRIMITYRDEATQNACHKLGLSNATFGSSPHNCEDAAGNPYSKAFDFAVYRDGDYVKNGADALYTQAGAIAEALGLAWGGRWTLKKDGCKPDYDHVQLTDWRNNSGI